MEMDRLSMLYYVGNYIEGVCLCHRFCCSIDVSCGVLVFSISWCFCCCLICCAAFGVHQMLCFCAFQLALGCKVEAKFGKKIVSRCGISSNSLQEWSGGAVLIPIPHGSSTFAAVVRTTPLELGDKAVYEQPQHRSSGEGVT